MSIDVSVESLVTLTQASKQWPGWPHISTLWRWYTIGVKGQKLETVCVGGRRFTSREALERSAAASTAARDGIPTSPPPRTSRQRRATIAAAERQLDAAGI
jgi:hypothetical protein